MTNRTLLAEARARGLSVLHSLMVADLLQGADRIRTQRIAIQDARIAARAAGSGRPRAPAGHGEHRPRYDRDP